MALTLDSIAESKCECESDNEEKKSCKVMAVDKKIKLLDKLRGGMRAAAVGLTFRSYFILKSKFPLIFHFAAELSYYAFVVLHSLFINKYYRSVFVYLVSMTTFPYPH
jgi:hypothetical protein